MAPHDHLTGLEPEVPSRRRGCSLRIATVDADFVLLDMGAGISLNIVDYLSCIAEYVLLVVDAGAELDRERLSLPQDELLSPPVARSQSEPRPQSGGAGDDQKNNSGIRTPFDLLEAVEQLDAPTGQYLKEQALAFRPRLLINQVRYPEDERLGGSMATVCRRHLGIDIDAIGAIQFDESVWKANRKRRPFMLDFPESNAGLALQTSPSHFCSRRNILVSRGRADVPPAARPESLSGLGSRLRRELGRDPIGLRSRARYL